MIYAEKDDNDASNLSHNVVDDICNGLSHFQKVGTWDNASLTSTKINRNWQRTPTGKSVYPAKVHCNSQGSYRFSFTVKEPY